MSPTAANSSSFYAVCVTGYGGLAYVADALTVFRDGQPQEICSPSNSSAVIADCHCLAVDGDFGNSKICSAGACCWEDLQCRHCSGGSRPAPKPILASWGGPSSLLVGMLRSCSSTDCTCNGSSLQAAAFNSGELRFSVCWCRIQLWTLGKQQRKRWKPW